MFVTVDRRMPYQQNLARFSIAVVVLRAATNRLADLRKLVAELLSVLPSAPPGSVT